jgi:hypothetical protein
MNSIQRDFHSSNLGDFELLRRLTQGTTRTLSSNPNSSKSLTNIFPARIGPTVCELLGPTVSCISAVLDSNMTASDTDPRC